jgi:hypothetical protein
MSSPETASWSGPARPVAIGFDTVAADAPTAKTSATTDAANTIAARKPRFITSPLS